MGNLDVIHKMNMRDAKDYGLDLAIMENLHARISSQTEAVQSVYIEMHYINNFHTVLHKLFQDNHAARQLSNDFTKHFCAGNWTEYTSQRDAAHYSYALYKAMMVILQIEDDSTEEIIIEALLNNSVEKHFKPYRITEGGSLRFLGGPEFSVDTGKSNPSLFIKPGDDAQDETIFAHGLQKLSSAVEAARIIICAFEAREKYWPDCNIDKNLALLTDMIANIHTAQPDALANAGAINAFDFQNAIINFITDDATLTRALMTRQ